MQPCTNYFLLARIEKHCCGRIAMPPCDIACRWTQANNEKAKEVLAGWRSNPRQGSKCMWNTKDLRAERNLFEELRKMKYGQNLELL